MVHESLEGILSFKVRKSASALEDGRGSSSAHVPSAFVLARATSAFVSSPQAKKRPLLKAPKESRPKDALPTDIPPRVKQPREKTPLEKKPRAKKPFAFLPTDQRGRSHSQQPPFLQIDQRCF